MALECKFQLNGPVWQTRVIEYQRKAMRNVPSYVEPQPGDPILYVPTYEGKKLLPPELQERIIEVLGKKVSMGNNLLLLELGISNLLEIAQEKSLELGKSLELDVLLGVIASFADKVKAVTS